MFLNCLFGDLAVRIHILFPAILGAGHSGDLGPGRSGAHAEDELRQLSEMYAIPRRIVSVCAIFASRSELLILAAPLDQIRMKDFLGNGVSVADIHSLFSLPRHLMHTSALTTLFLSRSGCVSISTRNRSSM
jgi:hypothetical protein